ncbi:MAG: hypothetical protein AAGF45_06875 [Pseudomonadota bacterium]
MADRFKDFARGLTAPASDAFAVTAHDSTDFPLAARALYVGRPGDVSLETLEGNEVTFVGVAAGTVLPVSAVRVNDTGTTAGDIVGLL